MGGRIPLVIEAYSGIAGALQAGTIAVAAARPIADFPDLPTVAETLPGFAAGGWQVLVAPIGTPAAIVRKLNSDLNKAMSDPDTRKQVARFNRDERLLSLAETLAFIEHEQATWARSCSRSGGRPKNTVTGAAAPQRCR